MQGGQDRGRGALAALYTLRTWGLVSIFGRRASSPVMLNRQGESVLPSFRSVGRAYVGVVAPDGMRLGVIGAEGVFAGLGCASRPRSFCERKAPARRPRNDDARRFGALTARCDGM